MVTLRSLVFLAWMYALMAVMGLLWLPSLLMPPRFARAGIRFYARLVRHGLRVICGVRTEIRGRENLPEGPVIYAAKHQCMWDVFIPFLILDDPVIILKRELLWYPVFGWYSLKTRMIPINRAGSARTLKQMTAVAVRRVAEGRQIVIFPEGTRHPPGVQPGYFAAGTSALYKRLDLACVPVATNSGLCWPARGFRRRPGTIVYEILPPIAPGLDRRSFMRRLEDNIEPCARTLLDEGLALQGRTQQDLEVA